MSCFNITLEGLNSCSKYITGTYQQVVFIRKTDIDVYDIISRVDNLTHQIKFTLKKDKKGYRFDFPQNGTTVEAKFNKVFSNGQPKYTHSITIGISGVTQADKWKLKQFDLSKDYFAVVQNMDNTVEVFGFQNGFSTSDYEYNDSALITLTSSFNEIDMPYVYKSRLTNNEVYEFDNDFAENKRIINEFNNDFSNDFNISS